MDFFPVIKSQLLFITIVLSTTTAAPCFGVDFPAPNRDVMTGGVEMTIPEKSIDLIRTLTLNSNESNNEPIPEGGVEDATLEWSDIGSDYTTETSEYETTTDTDEFNRIGAAPAVVASLLG